MNALTNALIVVDVQADFCEGGSLAVQGGAEVAQRIHDYMVAHSDDYLAIVATKCWHPAPANVPDFEHFAEQPNFSTTWPVHCVAGTSGAEFHKNLAAFEHATNSVRGPHGMRDTQQGSAFQFDKIFFKGQLSSAYSGFEGVQQWVGNEKLEEMQDPSNPFLLASYLRRAQIGHVDVVGIATDYCVKATAKDAIKNGFSCTVLTDMIAAVVPEEGEDALADMAIDGVEIATS